jgi:hypothetical protein
MLSITGDFSDWLNLSARERLFLPVGSMQQTLPLRRLLFLRYSEITGITALPDGALCTWIMSEF